MKKVILHSFITDTSFKIPDNELGTCLRVINKHHVGVENVNKIIWNEIKPIPGIEKHPNKTQLESAHWNLSACFKAKIKINVWSDGTKTIEVV